MGPPPGASPPMRMTASWSGSTDPTAYRSYAVGDKTLVSRRRPPLSRGTTNESGYHYSCSREDRNPGKLCHLVRLVRTESFDLGCNGAGARQQQDVQCPGKAYDRSPCGTGTSAKL